MCVLSLHDMPITVQLFFDVTPLRYCILCPSSVLHARCLSARPPLAESDVGYMGCCRQVGSPYSWLALEVLLRCAPAIHPHAYHARWSV